MRWKYCKEALVASLLLAGLSFCISIVPLKFEFIKPVKQEFDDFDIYDLYYTGNAKEQNGERSEDIILIQAANSRAAITEQIKKIKACSPAVAGVDLSFEANHFTAADSALIAALTDSSLVVTGYTLNTTAAGTALIEEKLLQPAFLQEAGGYMNFSSADSNAVIRSYAPFFNENEKQYLAFTSRIIQKYAPEKLEALRSRNNSTEYIHYSGNLNAYFNYTATEFDDLYKTKQLGHLKGKIILLGFFSKEDGSPKIMDDIKFSPLNEKPNGKSFPDMYGVVIHANIIRMVLQADAYVTAPGIWLSYLIAFLLSFFLSLLMIRRYAVHKPIPHLLLFVIQVVLAIVVIVLFVKLFDWFLLRINLVPIIITMVITIEMFDLYKKLAKLLARFFHYDTIFSHINTDH